jgi:hypothetical protein
VASLLQISELNFGCISNFSRAYNIGVLGTFYSQFDPINGIH